MDPTLATAVISAAVATIGTIITFVGRNRDSADRRLEMAFQANQELVDDLRAERTDLQARIAALESDTRTLHDEVRGLHARETELTEQIRVLRQREAELREWTGNIMTWAALAVSIIRGMGGSIDSPPGPPPSL